LLSQAFDGCLERSSWKPSFGNDTLAGFPNRQAPAPPFFQLPARNEECDLREVAVEWVAEHLYLKARGAALKFPIEAILTRGAQRVREYRITGCLRCALQRKDKFGTTHASRLPGTNAVETPLLPLIPTFEGFLPFVLISFGTLARGNSSWARAGMFRWQQGTHGRLPRRISTIGAPDRRSSAAAI